MSVSEYELVLMLDPESPDEQRDKIASDARTRIESSGSLKAEKAWGLRKLAYEIEKRNEADYRFFRFETESPLLDELNHNLRITDGVLRFRIFKVDPESPVIEPGPRSRLPARLPGAPAVAVDVVATRRIRRSRRRQLLAAASRSRGGATQEPAPSPDAPAPAAEEAAPAAEPRRRPRQRLRPSPRRPPSRRPTPPSRPPPRLRPRPSRAPAPSSSRSFRCSRSPGARSCRSRLLD